MVDAEFVGVKNATAYRQTLTFDVKHFSLMHRTASKTEKNKKTNTEQKKRKEEKLGGLSSQETCRNKRTNTPHHTKPPTTPFKSSLIKVYPIHTAEGYFDGLSYGPYRGRTLKEFVKG